MAFFESLLDFFGSNLIERLLLGAAAYFLDSNSLYFFNAKKTELAVLIIKYI